MTRKLLAIVIGVALAGVGTVALAGRNSGGTYSIPSVAGGYPFISGQTITSAGMNANLADVSSALSDSLSRSGNGGMTARLRGIDGTEALPAYSWTNDTNSGIYRIGADNIGISLGGTKKVDLSAGAAAFTDPTSFLSSVTVSGRARLTGGVYGSTTFNDAVTFLTSVTVPTASATTDATNKAYVDAAIALAVTTIPVTDAWHNVGAGGEPAFGAGWGNDAGFVPLRFKKIAGVVFVEGSVVGPGAPSDVVTLPSGYRPSATMLVLDADTGLAGPGTSTVASTGVLRTVGGAATRRSYNFSFPAD